MKKIKFNIYHPNQNNEYANVIKEIKEIIMKNSQLSEHQIIELAKEVQHYINQFKHQIYTKYTFTIYHHG